ncbi:TPA: septum formation protein Maf, partial [Streptococcus suis]
MQTVFDYQKEGSQPIVNSYILLSNSPRRKQLLEFLDPQIQSVEVDERGIE